MPTDRSQITLAEVVRRAVAIVDPPGEDPAVEEFAVRFEDADQPVRGQLDRLLQERVLWGADEDAPIVMAQAVTLYLAHRPEDFENTPEHILLHAARSEFDGNPPETVRIVARGSRREPFSCRAIKADVAPDWTGSRHRLRPVPPR